MIMIYGDGFANGTKSWNWKAQLEVLVVDVNIAQ
jgi:hypothetical protein